MPGARERHVEKIEYEHNEISITRYDLPRRASFRAMAYTISDLGCAPVNVTAKVFEYAVGVGRLTILFEILFGDVRL
jgi:hypothetical protein